MSQCYGFQQRNTRGIPYTFHAIYFRYNITHANICRYCLQYILWVLKTQCRWQVGSKIKVLGNFRIKQFACIKFHLLAKLMGTSYVFHVLCNIYKISHNIPCLGCYSITLVQQNKLTRNFLLASCPWGPVTANGVDLLTKIYVIYMETHIPKIMPIGPLAAAGEVATHRRKES